MVIRKKLIEVALPLDAINAASAYDKMPGIGPHPRGTPPLVGHGNRWRRRARCSLPRWWTTLRPARSCFPRMRSSPGAAAAVPHNRGVGEVGEHHQRDSPGIGAGGDSQELAADLRGQQEHPRAAELFDPDKLPAFHDPFAGGGTIPLEAQRLGLEAYASDLNPVAVLINKGHD